MSGETLTQRQRREQKRQQRSQLVTELLKILNIEVSGPEDGTTAPGDTATSTPTNVVSGAKAPAELSDQQRLMSGVRARLLGPFKENSPGANDKESAECNNARKKLQDALRDIELGKTSARRDKDLAALKQIAEETAKVFTEIPKQIAERAQIRADLKGRVLMMVPDGAPAVMGATDPENQGLVAQRKIVEQKLDAAATLDELKQIGTEVNQIGNAVRMLDDKVRDREQRREAVLKLERELKDPADSKPDPLRKLRDAVKAAFSNPPIDDNAVLAGEKALQDLQKAQATLESSLVPLRKKRDIGDAQLKEIKTTFEKYTTNVAAKQKSSVEISIVACQALLVSPLEEPRLDKLNASVWELREEIAKCVKNSYSNQQAVSDLIKYVRLEADKLIGDANGTPDRDQSVKTLKSDAKEYHKRIGAGLQKNSGAGLAQATKPLEDLRAAVANLRTKAGDVLVALMAARNQLLLDIQAADPNDCAKEYVTKLKAARNQVQTTLSATDLTQDVIDIAIDQADAFKALLAEAKADAEAAKRVQAAQNQLAKTFDGVKSKARGPVQVEIQRAYDAANARASLSGDSRDMVGADKLFGTLQARIKEVQSEKPVPQTAFTGIQVTGADVTEQVKQTVGALCGEALLGQLDAAGKTELCEAVASDGPAIEKLLLKGLGGNPKVFASVVKECGGEGLRELAKAFDGTDADTARSSLLELIESGGLAEHPRALASILQNDIARADQSEKAGLRTKNAASLKNLAGKFTGKDALATMRTMLSDCGLGTSPQTSTPPAIGSLLLDGFDGSPDNLLAFGKSFEGDSKEQTAHRANLKHLVDKAGVGDHPSVLGPLVKKAGAGKLKAIGAEFSSDQDAADLKTILDSGGMSGDTTIPGKRHEHPDTLAKVFEDGFAGDAKSLKKFTDAFKSHANESKQMLDAWNEWDEKYQDKRQPGVAIKALLEGKFNGNIKLLQTTFSTQILKIADPTRKKQAIRFAPHFCNDSASDKTGNLGAGISKVTASVEKRHKPETFDKSKMGNAPIHTQFPPGTDVEDLARKALTQLGNNVDKTQSHTLTVDNIRIEIGFLNNTTVNHFGPRAQNLPDDPHPLDTPDFVTDDINRILEGIGNKPAQP
jgi:hypothetical protein